MHKLSLNTMNAVDTNVLVRLLTRDDPKQTAIAETFVAEGAWASILAIAEATWVLRRSYRRSNAELVGIVDMLLQQLQTIVQDSDLVSAALELFRSAPSVGFSDCLMLELARKNGHLPLGTFDRALGRLPGTYKL